MSGNYKPWENILWNETHLQKMYRDWGVAYTKKQQFDNATYYYNKALDLKEDDATALHYRSLCYDDIAETSHALEDAVKACEIEDMDHIINLQVCDAFYNSNMFEKCKCELSTKMRKFTGWKVTQFQDRIDVVNQNCNDSLGDFAGRFLEKNRKYLPTVLKLWHKVEDTRPLWKIQHEQEKCDVVSVLEEDIKDAYPLELAKKNLYFRVFNQIYFNKGWVDVIFLRNLLKNKTLLLSQTKRSSPFLEISLKNNYTKITKFLKMLHARNPMYIQRYRMCPDQKLAAGIRRKHLYRVQYQTRRDMFNILNKLKELREKGNLKRMIKFVEDFVGNYTAIKTLLVMPRKLEFINEIYNIIALTYIDKLEIPSNIDSYPISNKLEVIMKLPIVKEDEQNHRHSVFGDKTAFRLPGTRDSRYNAYKKLIDRLENRLKFVKHPIEKCYLYHELSRRHLEHRKFEGALNFTKRVIEEATNCKNYAWMLIGVLQTARIYTSQKEIILLQESLKRAWEITLKLQNEKLMDYVMICRKISWELYKYRVLTSDLSIRPSLKYEYEYEDK